MLAYVPRFSKFLHACACLHVDAVSQLPYWFLPNEDGSLSPASWDEMADTPVVRQPQLHAPVSSVLAPLAHGQAEPARQFTLLYASACSASA